MDSVVQSLWNLVEYLQKPAGVVLGFVIVILGYNFFTASDPQKKAQLKGWLALVVIGFLLVIFAKPISKELYTILGGN